MFVRAFVYMFDRVLVYNLGIIEFYENIQGLHLLHQIPQRDRRPRSLNEMTRNVLGPLSRCPAVSTLAGSVQSNYISRPLCSARVILAVIGQL